MEVHQFKLFFDGRDAIRRCSFQKALPSFAQFLATCQDLFKDEFRGDHYRFMYLDNEGDWISLSSELEWQEMLSLCKETNAFPVKLHVKKTGAPMARSSVRLGESTIEADVSIDELEKLSQSFRPRDVSASTVLSPQIPSSTKPSVDTQENEVKRVMAESAKAFEQEQERLLQRVLNESRKAVEATTDVVSHAVGLVTFLANQGRDQLTVAEEKRQQQELENLERSRLSAANANEERLSNEKAVEEEKLRKVIDEETKQRHALELLRAQKEEEERKKVHDLLRLAKEEENRKAEEEKARRAKEEEILRRAKELVAKNQREKEEAERKKKEDEEKKRKEEEAAKLKAKEEEEKKRKDEEAAKLKAQEETEKSKVDQEFFKKATRFTEEIFQLRSLGFEHDVHLLVKLLEESGGDLVPVVDKLVSS